jgi:hypothetical protein
MTNKQYSRKEDTHRRKRKIRQYKSEAKKSGCSVCGYNKCHTALCFHHPNGNKADNYAKLVKGDGGSVASFSKEIRKTILLCLNCHAEAHYGMNGVKVPKFIHPSVKSAFEFGISVLQDDNQLVLLEGTRKSLIRNYIIINSMTIKEWESLCSIIHKYKEYLLKDVYTKGEIEKIEWFGEGIPIDSPEPISTLLN